MIDLDNLKKGDVIFESQYGFNIEIEVITDVETDNEGVDGRKRWKFVGMDRKYGKEIDYLITDGLFHYGPQLYEKPAYL